MTSSDADALALLVDQGAADHVRWVARSHEAILERWVDGYTIDVRRRESDVRAAIEAADRRVWVRVDGDTPVATAIAALVPHRYDTTTIVEVQALWTAPKHRRTGHARHLLEAIRTWGRAHEASAFAADVDPRDEATRRLLQGAGWAPKGLRLGTG